MKLRHLIETEVETKLNIILSGRDCFDPQEISA
jgi:hypothetical protein